MYLNLLNLELFQNKKTTTILKLPYNCHVDLLVSTSVSLLIVSSDWNNVKRLEDALTVTSYL